MAKTPERLNDVWSRCARTHRYQIKRNLMFGISTFLFLYYSWSYEHRPSSFCAEAASFQESNDVSAASTNQGNVSTNTTTTKKPQHRGRKTYAGQEKPGETCTPPGIDDFPEDLFTQEQLKHGYVIVHFVVSMYIFYSLALVCDDYFVPSMECICEELKMPSDIAGATFMAIATSAPELFTNIIATFITHGDIGIGTIVGSAVFNILAVCAVCGLGSGMVIPLEWYSITRDCFFYSISVFLLLSCLRDEKIFWYEGLLLVSVYALYILGMYNNAKFKRNCEKIVYRIRRKCQRIRRDPKANSVPMRHLGSALDPKELEKFQSPTEGQLTLEDIEKEEEREIDAAVDAYNDELESKELEVVEVALQHAEVYAEEEKDEFSLLKLPWGRSCRTWVEWFFSWPIRAVYTLTIPDCRVPRWRPWFPLTFVMCIVWIGVLSYIVNWMMTVIGHTLKIPDSVMGLTFIAAGTSIPEVVSSLIVSRQGLGTMALSNSIGSNTFDILMCLGLPWLIQASILAKDPVEPYIQINSHGLEYSAMMLILSLFLLYVILAANRYVLDRKVGLVSLSLYLVFLVMASLFELNVFFPVNLPTCLHFED